MHVCMCREVGLVDSTTEDYYLSQYYCILQKLEFMAAVNLVPPAVLEGNLSHPMHVCTYIPHACTCVM